jgi:hypothetical protein
VQMFAAAGVRYAGADFVFISFFSFMTSCVLRPVCLAGVLEGRYGIL